MPTGKRILITGGARIFGPNSWNTIFITITSITISILFAAYRGQDINWDQKNYHIGVPYLLMSGTFWQSVAPAGIQSYFNPSLHLFQFFGITHLKPLIFCVFLTFIQSFAFILAGFVCVNLTNLNRGSFSRNEATLLSLFGFILCLLSPIALSELGTTFIDLITAIPIIAAFTLPLLKFNIRSKHVAIYSGALLGFATALKLTNAVFLFGVVGFIFTGTDKISDRLKWLLNLYISALIGILIIGGPWFFILYQKFGNPFFPFYNNIFHSPDYPNSQIRDMRFPAHSILDFWRYPLYWLFGGSPSTTTGSPSSELPLGDARWAFTTFGSFILLIFVALSKVYRRNLLTDNAGGLFLSVLISYTIWIFQFGIHRYMVAIDILCGACILYLIVQIPLQSFRYFSMTFVMAVTLAVIKVPDWGHLPWQPQWQLIINSVVQFDQPVIVFLSEKPTLFIAKSFPENSYYIGSYGDFNLMSGANNSLARQLDTLLNSSLNIGMIEVDSGSVPSYTLDLLSSYNLSVSDNCNSFNIANETYRYCKVEHK